MNYSFNKVFLLLAITLNVGVLHAQSSCTEIRADGQNYYTIKAQLDHHTHVVLPEVVQGLPLVGNKELWDVESPENSNHLLIKPNSTLDEGSSTTVSVVSSNNNPYFFVVKRVKAVADYCVFVSPTQSAFSDGNNNALALSNPNYKLQKDNEALQDKLKEQKETANINIINAIKKYQDNVHSSYKISTNGNVPSKLISVWDDGRFTYFRFDHTRFGVPIIEAKINRKKQLLEMQPHDDNHNTFKVVGIYKTMYAKFDKSTYNKVTRIQ